MKSKIVGFVLIVIMIMSLSGVLIYKLLMTGEKPNLVVNVEMTISEYAYTLDSRDSGLMKEEFKSLKTNLESNNPDYEEYAKSLAKLYIIDLYTISNKINIYDIPCLEYLLPPDIENFKTNIKNTLYLYLKDNVGGKRHQELPTVKSIRVDNLKLITYEIDKVEYDAYEIELSWEYESELGYDKQAILTIIKKDNKLFVVKDQVKE